MKQVLESCCNPNYVFICISLVWYPPFSAPFDKPKVDGDIILTVITFYFNADDPIFDAVWHGPWNAFAGYIPDSGQVRAENYFI